MVLQQRSGTLFGRNANVTESALQNRIPEKRREEYTSEGENELQRKKREIQCSRRHGVLYMQEASTDTSPHRSQVQGDRAEGRG